MDQKETAFVDRMGLVMERIAGGRTMGRLYAWLLICDPPDQSLTDLAAELGVSKTMVSTVARQLEAGGMIERVPTPSREHRYQVARGGWAQIMRSRLAALDPITETLGLGLSTLGDERPDQRALLEETREFFAFLIRDAEESLQRWEEYRKRLKDDDQGSG
ncbi:GbsR/MarR family transcriptional regulator [Nonomuraea angiospora]|uniref:DNA-binding transcriptional regulator GbsR (MarR family) n=1 Tax=Nonomuraea angiospora TaxID=46172 RepID=A0ABR9LU78_9ACTN|nr:MarR family transcriptional regulator [Nonomuraea angiospora]MBE1583813.1 DNA-binding transcriptional regulator GbsR (MarR family) [Nonomuraea angiospora]